MTLDAACVPPRPLSTRFVSFLLRHPPWPRETWPMFRSRSGDIPSSQRASPARPPLLQSDA